MATAEQIKSLIRTHFDRDEEKFRTIVLQIAASEARVGHSTLARELKGLIDKQGKGVILKLNYQSNLFTDLNPTARFNELIVSDELHRSISKILIEFAQRDKLYHYGLSNRRKILLEGPSGTGKTMTASIIASELHMPLLVVQMDKIISKFMGETSIKLRQLFETIDQISGVYLFDEFDAIGADRSLDNEVGEMRRVLNAFLQLIENDTSDSIIIAATNNNKILDHALYRRFDDVLHYQLPTKNEIVKLFEIKLTSYFGSVYIDDKTIALAQGLSQAEITKICDDVIKVAIIENCGFSIEKLRSMITTRSSVYKSKEA
jgi:AAA+ superfamily predicted ATPase